MTTGTLNNRKGIIEIPNSAIKQLDVNILRVLFSNFYPVNIERDGFDDSFRYYGYSEHFTEIGEGIQIPKYEPIITTTETGLTIAFNEIK